MIAQNKEAFQGKYWNNRWNLYIRRTIELITDFNIHLKFKNVLEIGCNKIPMFKDSKTADIMKGTNYPDYNFDASKPWPKDLPKFDLIVASQVWEHLEGKQIFAFNQAMSHCKYLVLTLPYKWDCKDKTNGHDGIDMTVINEWASGRNPIYSEVMNEGKPNKERIFLIYES